MNRKSKELKRLARESLNQRYHIPMTVFFLSTFLVLLIEMPFSFYLNSNPTSTQYLITLAADFFISLISVILNAGVLFVHMNLSREKECSLKQLFFGFKEHPERFVKAALLLMLISFACFLPLIVGVFFLSFLPNLATGITIFILCTICSIILNVYFILTYDMVFFILIDSSDYRVIDAFRKSRSLMNGQKGRLLYLHLSFLGWYPIILLSFGIASLWIMPYQNQTMVKFYSDLIGELD